MSEFKSEELETYDPTGPVLAAFFEDFEGDEIEYNFNSAAECRDFLNGNKQLKLICQMVTTGEILCDNITEYSDEQCEKIDKIAREMMKESNENWAREDF